MPVVIWWQSTELVICARRIFEILKRKLVFNRQLTVDMFCDNRIARFLDNEIQYHQYFVLFDSVCPANSLLINRELPLDISKHYASGSTQVHTKGRSFGTHQNYIERILNLESIAFTDNTLKVCGLIYSRIFCSSSF